MTGLKKDVCGLSCVSFAPSPCSPPDAGVACAMFMPVSLLIISSSMCATPFIVIVDSGLDTEKLTSSAHV